MLNIDQAYITHFKPLAERKKKIKDSIKFNLKWIEEEPTEQQWTYDRTSWFTKTSIKYRRLKDSEVSLAYKHIQAYRDIVFNRHETSLILEDDVILCDNFEHYFNLFLSQTPDDWDLIFIGSGCNLRVNWCSVVEGRPAYKKSHPATKCTDSYCIKNKAAKKILETIIPFSCPIDFELNYQMELHNMNVYWWEPTLVEQGSQNGLYGSSIQ